MVASIKNQAGQRPVDGASQQEKPNARTLGSSPESSSRQKNHDAVSRDIDNPEANGLALRDVVDVVAGNGRLGLPTTAQLSLVEKSMRNLIATVFPTMKIRVEALLHKSGFAAHECVEMLGGVLLQAQGPGHPHHQIALNVLCAFIDKMGSGRVTVSQALAIHTLALAFPTLSEPQQQQALASIRRKCRNPEIFLPFAENIFTDLLRTGEPAAVAVLEEAAQPFFEAHDRGFGHFDFNAAAIGWRVKLCIAERLRETTDLASRPAAFRHGIQKLWDRIESTLLAYIEHFDAGSSSDEDDENELPGSSDFRQSYEVGFYQLEAVLSLCPTLSSSVFIDNNLNDLREFCKSVIETEGFVDEYSRERISKAHTEIETHQELMGNQSHTSLDREGEPKEPKYLLFLESDHYKGLGRVCGQRTRSPVLGHSRTWSES